MDWLSQSAAALSRRSVFDRVGRWGLALSGGVMLGLANGPQAAQAACGAGCIGVGQCLPEGTCQSCCDYQNADCTTGTCCCEQPGPNCCARAYFDYDTGNCGCYSPCTCP